MTAKGKILTLMWKKECFVVGKTGLRGRYFTLEDEAALLDMMNSGALDAGAWWARAVDLIHNGARGLGQGLCPFCSVYRSDRQCNACPYGEHHGPCTRDDSHFQRFLVPALSVTQPPNVWYRAVLHEVEEMGRAQDMKTPPGWKEVAESLGQVPKLTVKQFRAMLNLFMCSDPWPADKEDHAVLENLLNDEARKRQWENLVSAYHAFKNPHAPPVCAYTDPETGWRCPNSAMWKIYVGHMEAGYGKGTLCCEEHLGKMVALSKPGKSCTIERVEWKKGEK